ncbi:hypothetical protein [Galbibacter sp. PAP.153]|uniref:hypothetical protein n=1 Tax=Galbibacter sp. PAP.153 TaxID=3104623 RepID=UPI0030080D41
MIHIEDKFIKENISYPMLIEALKLGFRESKIECPPKLAYNYKSSVSEKNNTMLMMPAWDNEQYFGVKLIAATPHNKTVGIPYLNGSYILFNAKNGLPLASMDAKLITNMRTAATSVLASSYLCRKDASDVLILGNGSLSPYYISAYASLGHVKSIYVWGRQYEKSQKVVASVQLPDRVQVQAVKNFKELIPSMDIISCITSSYDPLIVRDDMGEGQHFDLAGSYTSEMMEVDTDVVKNCTVFTDNFNITLEHAGELVNALKEGKLNKEDIQGDFEMLCKDDTSKRRTSKENTLFKCTGMALEDLVMAQLIHKAYGQTGK